MGTSQRRTLSQSIALWLASGLDRLIPTDSRLYSWARRVDSPKDLPGLYRPFLDGLPARQREPWPYLVLTPTFRGIGRRSEPERLVCLVADAVHVAEQRLGQLTSARFPLHGQCLVERGVLLLHSWLTLHASAPDGAASSVTLRFNTVTDHLMAPFIDALRAAPLQGSAVDAASERRHFDFLVHANYKFFSHGRNSIRPGCRVLQVLFQPALRSRRPVLFGFAISKRISPAHLTVLTDTELVTIRDDESQSWIQGSAPGAIWTYIPRGLINSISLHPRGDGFVELRIQPDSGPQLTSVFDATAQPELMQLVSRLSP